MGGEVDLDAGLLLNEPTWGAADRGQTALSTDWAFVKFRGCFRWGRSGGVPLACRRGVAPRTSRGEPSLTVGPQKGA